MDLSISNLIEEKVRVVSCLSSDFESWGHNLRTNYGVDTIESSFQQNCTFHYIDRVILSMREIDEIEFNETCARNTLVKNQVSELRNLQENFRIDLSLLVSRISSTPKRILQRAKNLSELYEKKQFVEKWICMTCPITQEAIINPVESPCCKRIFEKKAFDTWIRKSSTCPICRSPIRKEKNDYIIEKKAQPNPPNFALGLFCLGCLRISTFYITQNNQNVRCSCGRNYLIS